METKEDSEVEADKEEDMDSSQDEKTKTPQKDSKEEKKEERGSDEEEEEEESEEEEPRGIHIHVISLDVGVFPRIFDTFPDSPPICFAFRFAKKSVFMHFM